ncbi:hypothetical protein pb186bvf_004619 [Paramecium bursaria]
MNQLFDSLYFDQLQYSQIETSFTAMNYGKLENWMLQQVLSACRNSSQSWV